MSFLKGGLFHKIQSIQAYVSPPIAAAFLFGILSRRVTERAAKISLLSGAALGLTQLVLEISQDKLSGFLYELSALNFLHFAFILIVICALILFAFSRSREAKPDAEIACITWQKGNIALASGITNVALSVVLMLAVITLWILIK